MDGSGAIIGKYRKVHLPGHREHEPWRPFQHLEKRYFEKGDLGLSGLRRVGRQIGMCICNDRRWPETWRVLGLAGAELVMLGYNTPAHYPPAPEHDHLQYFHNEMSLQAGCLPERPLGGRRRQGRAEEGCDLIGGSLIVAPTGEIVARAATLEDEVITARVDLDRCSEIRANIFNFAEHRQPAEYSSITER